MRYRKTCKVCGKEKKVPAKLQKDVQAWWFLADPYCSRKCHEIDRGLGSESQDKKTGRKVA